MSMLDKITFWKKKDEAGPNKDFTDPEFGRDFVNPDNETELDNPFDQRGQEDPTQPNAFGVPKDFDPGKSFQVGKTINNSPGQNQLNGINEQLLEKNIEIVSSKIDTIKSEIENMSQRLSNIEALAKKEADKDAHKRYRSAQW